MWRIAVGMAMGFLLLGPASAQQGPGWVTSQNGCRAWNSVMQPNRTFTWSGGCEHGLVSGQGVLQWYDDGVPGDRYEGEWRDGHENGRGVFLSAHGDRYEGQFKNDLPNGQGSFRSVRGEVYSGTWSSGCFRDGDRRAAVGTSLAQCR